MYVIHTEMVEKNGTHFRSIMSSSLRQNASMRAEVRSNYVLSASITYTVVMETNKKKGIILLRFPFYGS